MSLQKFKVLTFDVVGTLIDFERGMIEYIRGAVSEAAQIGDDAILDAYRHVGPSRRRAGIPTISCASMATWRGS